MDVAIGKVLSSAWFVLGPEVDAFEEEFATSVEAAECVGVGSGLDAIELALRALGVQAGDEVIVPANTYVATWLAVTRLGAVVVPVEPDKHSFNLDPTKVEDAISPRTRAIVAVHLYGQPADMTALAALAAKHHLALVEDAAQSHLATADGRAVGTIGVAAATSFYPTKNLGALGDGGAVLTQDAQLAARVKRLRNGGQTSRYHHEEPGVNTRLDEMQAAILRARLRYLPQWTAKRRAIAAHYRAALNPADGRAFGEGASVIVPREFDAGHVYHLFPVLTETRDRFQAHMSAWGVETLIHYPVPIPRQPALASASPAMCAVADRVCAQVVSLPMYPALTDAAVATVIDAVAAFNG